MTAITLGPSTRCLYLVLVAAGSRQVSLLEGLPGGQHGGGKHPGVWVLFVLLSTPLLIQSSINFYLFPLIDN